MAVVQFLHLTNCVAHAEDCDEDIQEYCMDSVQGSRSGVWGIGAAGRCLSKQLAEGQYMNQGCKKLVLAAAPKVRNFVQFEMHSGHGFCEPLTRGDSGCHVAFMVQ